MIGNFSFALSGGESDRFAPLDRLLSSSPLLPWLELSQDFSLSESLDLIKQLQSAKFINAEADPLPNPSAAQSQLSVI